MSFDNLTDTAKTVGGAKELERAILDMGMEVSQG